MCKCACKTSQLQPWSNALVDAKKLLLVSEVIHSGWFVFFVLHQLCCNPASSFAVSTLCWWRRPSIGLFAHRQSLYRQAHRPRAFSVQSGRQPKPWAHRPYQNHRLLSDCPSSPDSSASHLFAAICFQPNLDWQTAVVLSQFGPRATL